MEMNRVWIVGLLSWMAIAVLSGCSQQPPEGESDRQPTVVGESPDHRAANRPASGVPVPQPREKPVGPQTTAAAQVYSKPDNGRQLAPPKGAPDATAPKMPQVVLTDGHAALCRVRVGDTLPAIELKELDETPHKLSDLFGEKLTVVCFWSGRQVLGRAELADLGPDVVARFADRGVAVVGIAEEPTADAARHWATDAAVSFPILLDPKGDAVAQVGNEKLPRTYLIDRQGTILWFDIEYSRATRRELSQAIWAALGK